MTDELLAYLLDDLPPRRREEVELKIQSDPQWRREYERLRECFDASQQEVDLECVDQPPADLAQRTCKLVDSGEFAAPNLSSGAAMSDDAAPASSHRSRWSLADVTVAVGVLLVLFGLLSPALRSDRDRSRREQCAKKLLRVGTWLHEAAELHGGLLPAVQADEPMGKMAWLLSEQSGMPVEQAYSAFFCPNSPLADAIAKGDVKLRVKGWPEMRNADGESRRLVILFLGEMYAFQAGQLDKRGSVRPLRLTLSTYRPIASHAPTITVDGRVNFDPQGCRNQMIFQDMHIGPYQPIGALEGDDPFLNDNGEHAASDREDDVTLLRGNVTPFGPRREFRLEVVPDEADSDKVAPDVPQP